MNVSLRRVATSGFTIWMVALVAAIYLLIPLREKITFGIDLVGGTYITLEVQTDKAVEAAFLDKVELLTNQLKKAKNEVPKVALASNEAVMTFSSVAAAQAAATTIKADKDILLRSQAETVTINFTDRMVKYIQKDAVERNIEVLRTRLNKLNVAEISIAAKGEKQIEIELPDVNDPQQAKAMIGRAAILEFKIVEREGSSPEDILYEYDGQLPSGMEIVPGMKDGEEGRQHYYLVHKRAPVTGKDLKDSRPVFNEQRGEMAVGFTFTPEGGQKFYELTSKNYRRTLAAILDGTVVTAATIQEPIRTDGQISRGGGFPPAEAKELSTLLKSGSFVAPVTFEEERQVGPTLGAEAIRQGLISCLVGLVLLFLFSVFFYKVAGLFAFATLLYNLVLIMVGMMWLKATLTLPGIAGLVLTVGMAIDASILIYERIREELALGIPLKRAVQDGFSDAMRVILDANITTFIVGAVLYKFGTGPIQGFAVTIMLGIIATLITGLFFLRSIFNLLINTFNVQKIKI